MDNLAFIAEDEGFELIDYNPHDNSPGFTKLIDELSIRKLIEAGKTFTFLNKNIKLIFINEKMDAEDKLYALAHELGHIRCGHLKNGVHQTSVQEEVAANEFAHYLLHPPVSYKLKKWSSVHKSPIIVSLVIIMIAVIAMVIIHQVTLENSYYGEYYVTASGERYHEKDCITIKDKDNVRRLTQEDIDSGKYTPCQICLPE